MALKIPQSLKLAHLKNLAFQCGISTSGTKALLTNRLINELVLTLPHHGLKTCPPCRILSIDMGIRNLAYCILDMPSDPFPAIGASVPSIAAWRRIAVTFAPTSSDKETSPLLVLKEAFDPPTLSAAAYVLLRHKLLPYSPTHILIERQRFRSMGSPHILEWTVRVNMFESMLHAVLQTLKNENIWQGTVISIMPGKVGPFWVEPNPGLGSDLALTKQTGVRKLRNTKNAKLLNKGAKIDLVKTWLETKQMLDLGTPEAALTAKAYLEKWHRLPGRKKGKSITSPRKPEEMEEIGKLDDLADSLLQGMAWMQWERNKRQVLEKGVEALDVS